MGNSTSRIEDERFKGRDWEADLLSDGYRIFAEGIAAGAVSYTFVVNPRTGDTGAHVLASIGDVEALTALSNAYVELKKRRGRAGTAADMQRWMGKLWGVVNAKGRTPLMLACKAGRTEAVRYLLIQHANPTVRDSEGGSTAAHLAAAAGHEDVLRALAAYHPPHGRQLDHSLIDSPDGNGLTPLHHAVWAGRHATTSLLCDLGAKLGAKTAWEATRGEIRVPIGYTPLHVAAMRGAPRCTLALLAAYNDILSDPRQNAHPPPDPRQEQDQNGYIPFAVANMYGHSQLLAMLHPLTPLNSILAERERMERDDAAHHQGCGVPTLEELAAKVAQQVLAVKLEDVQKDLNNLWTQASSAVKAKVKEAKAKEAKEKAKKQSSGSQLQPSAGAPATGAMQTEVKLGQTAKPSKLSKATPGPLLVPAPPAALPGPATPTTPTGSALGALPEASAVTGADVGVVQAGGLGGAALAGGLRRGLSKIASVPSMQDLEQSSRSRVRLGVAPAVGEGGIKALGRESQQPLGRASRRPQRRASTGCLRGKQFPAIPKSCTTPRADAPLIRRSRPIPARSNLDADAAPAVTASGEDAHQTLSGSTSTVSDDNSSYSSDPNEPYRPQRTNSFTIGTQLPSVMRMLSLLSATYGWDPEEFGHQLDYELQQESTFNGSPRPGKPLLQAAPTHSPATAQVAAAMGAGLGKHPTVAPGKRCPDCGAVAACKPPPPANKGLTRMGTKHGKASASHGNLAELALAKPSPAAEAALQRMSRMSNQDSTAAPPCPTCGHRPKPRRHSASNAELSCTRLLPVQRVNNPMPCPTGVPHGHAPLPDLNVVGLETVRVTHRTRSFTIGTQLPSVVNMIRALGLGAILNPAATLVDQQLETQIQTAIQLLRMHRLTYGVGSMPPTTQPATPASAATPSAAALTPAASAASLSKGATGSPAASTAPNKNWVATVTDEAGSGSVTVRRSMEAVHSHLASVKAVAGLDSFVRLSRVSATQKSCGNSVVSETEPEVCGVCLDVAQRSIKMNDCDHSMCVTCTKELMRLHVDKTPRCPFCRSIIMGFSPVPPTTSQINAMLREQRTQKFEDF